MNQGLPKAIQEALARQTPGDVHPSADALTAFVEHGLPQLESQRVTDHLAQCADCREVVFLASSAVEEPVGEEQELMPATAVPRISPALLAKDKEAPVEASRRRAWTLRWVRVTAAAAVLLVAGVVIEKRLELARPGPMIATKEQPPATTTSEQAAVAFAPPPGAETKVAPQAETELVLQKPATKPARTQTRQARTTESLAFDRLAPAPLEKSLSTPEASATPPPASPPSVALDALVKSAPAAPPMQNAFVQGEAQSTTSLAFEPRPSMEKPQMAMRAATMLHPQWRVTSDGHLERSTTPGSWTPVLADQPTAFHVVSVVRNNVWAGGSGGALFHSSDGGQNWSREPLAGEMGTIVSIQFSDATHGDVTTDGGSRWNTSDGGLSWTKE